MVNQIQAHVPASLLGGRAGRAFTRYAAQILGREYTHERTRKHVEYYIHFHSRNLVMHGISVASTYTILASANRRRCCPMPAARREARGGGGMIGYGSTGLAATTTDIIGYLYR